MSIQRCVARLRSARTVVARLRRDEKGSVAIEMAMISLPFFMMIFGATAIGLYFMTSFMLERGVDQTARLIRTCAFKSANDGAGWNTLQLKEAVCQNAPGFVSCGSKLRVSLSRPLTFGAIAPGSLRAASCVDGSGNLIPETANAADAVSVTGNTIALLTACYQYDLGGMIPLLNLGETAGSNVNLIQASMAVMVEPCD